LPEDSFEFSSVFYLKRHGFAIEQVKNFAEKFRVTMARQKFMSDSIIERLEPDMDEMKQIIMDFDGWRTANHIVDVRKEPIEVSSIVPGVQEINTSFQF
jgi:hypothetical protein